MINPLSTIQSVSNETAKNGIYSVQFQMKGAPVLIFFIHHQGVLFTPLPGTTFNSIRQEYQNSFPIEHEVIKMLNYDGEKCTDQVEYDYSLCRENYYHNVSKRFL